MANKTYDRTDNTDNIREKIMFDCTINSSVSVEHDITYKKQIMKI